MRRRWKIFLLSACGLIAVVGICFFSLREKEPSYNGRTLSEWLERSVAFDPRETNDVPEVRRQEAITAMRHFGGDALPWLVKWLEPRDWQFSGERMINRMPGWLRFRRLENWAEDQHVLRQVRGLAVKHGFEILGTNAAPALPLLARRFTNSTDGACMYACIITQCGDAGRKVLTDLAKTSDASHRAVALEILSRMPSGSTKN